jgi:hypothetical protein
MEQNLLQYPKNENIKIIIKKEGDFYRIFQHIINSMAKIMMKIFKEKTKRQNKKFIIKIKQTNQLK